jgi:hypothetical protein
MDLELLDRLMKLFDESKSETLELEYNDTKIIEKNSTFFLKPYTLQQEEKNITY